MKPALRERLLRCVGEVMPSTTRTCIWIMKLTVGVSFAVMLLKYVNILPYIAHFVDPVFRYFGLPGEAALAFVSGYFVNVYSALAVMSTLEMDTRAVTILATMVLCSHAMILETAVMKKTGANPFRMVLVRTLSAFALGCMLNWVLPGEARPSAMPAPSGLGITEPLWPVVSAWGIATVKLLLLMVTVIYSLNILQRILSEFGVTKKLSGFLRPLMRLFGLPPHTAFLWIVANVVGLGYGSAAMLDELSRGQLSRRDVDYLDTHIGISHSNLEDLLLMTAAGGVWWIMLLVRWTFSFLLVWEFRLENALFHRREKAQPIA